MLCYIVLAAGQSKRFRSRAPKILFQIHGKSLLDYVLESIPANKKDIFIVSNIPYKDYVCIPQAEPLGTGHAVQEALKHIPSTYTDCIILCGDVPLITKETLRNLSQSTFDLTLIGFRIDDLTKSYGRIIGNGEKIVEYKEASEEVKNNPHAYSGTMKVRRHILDATLPLLRAHPEFYVTEIVEKTNAQRGVIFKTEEEFTGVNTKADLAYVERALQKKWIHQLMEEGVVFYNPDTSSVYHDTKIEQDVIIHPHVHIGKNVVIEEGVVIYPFTCLEDCYIKKGARVGPFAHIRGYVVLENNAIVGNFVEVKKSKIGAESKVKHLSYIGDAVLGENVNVGAGVITCNYDGVKKHQTTIEDYVFVGSNTALIAPLTIHDHAYIGAGSVITDDVESYDLVFTRAEKTTKKGWTKKRVQRQLL